MDAALHGHHPAAAEPPEDQIARVAGRGAPGEARDLVEGHRQLGLDLFGEASEAGAEDDPELGLEIAALAQVGGGAVDGLAQLGHLDSREGWGATKHGGRARARPPPHYCGSAPTARVQKPANPRVKRESDQRDWPSSPCACSAATGSPEGIAGAATASADGSCSQVIG